MGANFFLGRRPEGAPLTLPTGVDDSGIYVNLQAIQYDGGVVLKVAGRMDADQATAFEEECKAWVARGAGTLIVDLSELTYISSLGLRSFVAIGKLQQEKGGSLRLCCLTGLVKQVFEITRLNSMFPIHESVDAALAGV
jgi:anti-anti-sigma factor